MVVFATCLRYFPPKFTCVHYFPLALLISSNAFFLSPEPQEPLPLRPPVPAGPLHGGDGGHRGGPGGAKRLLPGIFRKETRFPTFKKKTLKLFFPGPGPAGRARHPRLRHPGRGGRLQGDQGQVRLDLVGVQIKLANPNDKKISKHQTSTNERSRLLWKPQKLHSVLGKWKSR